MGQTKQLPLKNGGFALVDAADFARLNGFHWQMDSKGYPCHRTKQGFRVYLARQVMSLVVGDSTQIRYIDRDPLNCSRDNLTFHHCSAVETNCGVCGEGVRRSPSKAYGNVFCGRRCASRAKQVRVSLQCERCGAGIERIPSHLPKSGRAQCEACLSCHYDGSRVADLTCKHCRKQITRGVSRTKGRFCSRDCKRAYDKQDFAKVYRMCQLAAERNTKYTSEIVKRFLEWEGHACAFPLCGDPKRPSSKWNLCALHTKRFNGVRLKWRKINVSNVSNTAGAR